MLTPYVKVKVSTDGETKLITFLVPGVDLVLLQEKNRPLQAFGEMPNHDIENLASAAKYKIDLEISRLVGARYLPSRVEALEGVKLYIDQLLAGDKIEEIKRRNRSWN